MMTTRAELLVDIARHEIGVREDAGRPNRGQRVDEYQRADWLPGEGYAWCASFVCWCLQRLETRMSFKFDPTPKTPAAFGLIDWGRKAGCQIIQPLPSVCLPGDIVVFDSSHVGIVSECVTDLIFKSIEGNTNEAGGREGYIVLEKQRSIRTVRNFVRLPNSGNGSARKPVEQSRRENVMKSQRQSGTKF